MPGILGLALVTGGAFALVLPLRQPSTSFHRVIRGPGDLADLTVNAHVVSTSERGVRLCPIEARPISVISPELPADGPFPTAEFVVSVPDPPIGGVPTVVRFLWQDRPAPDFRYEEQVVRLDALPRTLRFDTPGEAGRFHRVGVQFPTIRTDVILSSMRLAPPPVLGEGAFERVAEQIVARQPIDGRSLNYVRGPAVLGRGMNYWLLGALCCTAGLVLVVAACSRKRATPRLLTLIGLAAAAAIFASDAWSTQNLFRHARDEVRGYRGRPASEQVRLAYGTVVGWAYDALVEASAPGTRYAVLTDGGETPVHRLDYLLAPYRTRTGDIAAAEFILVLGANDAKLDTEGGTLRVGNGPAIPVRMVAKYASTVFLVAVVRPRTEGQR